MASIMPTRHARYRLTSLVLHALLRWPTWWTAGDCIQQSRQLQNRV